MSDTFTIPVDYKIKRKGMLSWYFPIICLSVLTVLPFLQEYEGSSVVYYGKHSFLVLFLCILFFKNKNAIDIKKMLPFVSFVFVASTLPAFITSDLSRTIPNILMYTTVSLSIFIFPKITFKQFKTILKIMLITLFFFVTLPSLLNTADAFMYSNYGGRFRFVGALINSNALGKLSFLGFILSVRLWVFWKGFIKKTFLLFMMTSSVYLIYLADSRASLMVVFMIVLSIMTFNIYVRLPKKLVFSFASFLSIIPLAIFLYIINTPTMSIDVASLSTGRTEIWKETIFDMDWKGYLVGMGLSIGQGSHNGYLEIFRFFGVIGVVIWIPLLVNLVIKKWKASKYASSYIGFGMVVSLLVYHLVEGSLVSLANLASIYFWLELLQRSEIVSRED